MKYVLAVFLCLVASLAQAQSRITVALDESFVRTTWGPPIKLGNGTYHPRVSFHKVIQHKGRVYACVAITFANTGAGPEFATRSRLVTAQGTIIRRNLRDWTYLSEVLDVSRKIEVPRDVGEGMRKVSVYPASFRRYAGTPISCRVTRRTPTPAFFTNDTRLVVPQRIKYWVRL